MLFDEASQLGVAHALALAPLARSAAFAGDPKQLAPITLSDATHARKWMGQSMFEHMAEGRANSVLLNEQSRMCSAICDLVSQTFYKGKLQVATESQRDRAWEWERSATPISTCGTRPTVLLQVQTDGEFNHYYKGPCRPESAAAVANIAKELLDRGMLPAKIVILTPYHAQRLMIKQAMTRLGLPKLDISTVHSIQGSERHTVIFDPVQGGEPFFRNEMGGDRLINVAISRAMARLILVLSPGDRQNLTLNRLATAMHCPVVNVNAKTVHDFVGRKDYPQCLVGQTIAVPGLVGTVVRFTKSDKMIHVLNAERNAEVPFKLSIVEEKTRREDPPATDSASHHPMIPAPQPHPRPSKVVLSPRVIAPPLGRRPNVAS